MFSKVGPLQLTGDKQGRDNGGRGGVGSCTARQPLAALAGFPSRSNLGDNRKREGWVVLVS